MHLTGDGRLRTQGGLGGARWEGDVGWSCRGRCLADPRPQGQTAMWLGVRWRGARNPLQKLLLCSRTSGGCAPVLPSGGNHVVFLELRQHSRVTTGISAKASRKQSSLSGKESAQVCIPAQRFPASSVLARAGAGCGSVGDVPGAWLIAPGRRAGAPPLWQLPTMSITNTHTHTHTHTHIKKPCSVSCHLF